MIEFLSEGNISINKVYVHPIWERISVHPHNDGLSLLYIYDMDNDREVVINLKNIDNHTTTLEKFNFDFNECYVYDNKSLLNHLSLDNSIDASLVKYLQSNTPLKSNLTPTHLFYHRRFNNLNGVNNLIPISKHIEMISDVKDEFPQILRFGWSGVRCKEIWKISI